MSNVDFSKITEGIYHVIETEEKILTGLQNDTITLKRNKQNRTIKQILGHLIDSASNTNAWSDCNTVKICFSFPITVRIMICG